MGGMLALCLLGALTSGLAWELNHGLLLAGAGLLMLLFPPVVRLPWLWWGLALAALIAGGLAFLPASVWGVPEWRAGLEAAGLDTGTRQVVQVREALEMAALQGLVLLVGLWLLGHRAADAALPGWVLGFTLTVAAYAGLSLVLREAGALSGHNQHFGFFPNRNHTATLLAMGAMTGFASLVQAIRDKRWGSLGFSALGLAVCLMAVFGWSISRAGLLLVAIGLVLWLPNLGRGYLGQHAGKAIALLVLAAGGLFLLTDNGLKQRLEDQLEEIAPVDSAELAGTAAGPGEKAGFDAGAPLDFRVLIWRDSLCLIRHAPWSGVGPGQYAAVIPFFRDATLERDDSDALHPESDWLWLAAESGLPAALIVLVLVGAIGFAGWRSGRAGRRRALRLGCLVAAGLLAVHGIFDVPGHRVPLAWTAALLAALALPAGDRHRRPAGWPFRLLGLPVLGAGLWLLSVMHAEPPTGSVAGLGSRMRHEVRALYREDQARLQTARESGQSYDPAPAEDPLQQALDRIDPALERLPMDRTLWHWKGYLALHYDDKYAQVEQAFRIERALDPDWIGAPLRQARSWLPQDVERTRELWQDALARAGRIDERIGEDSGNGAASDRTRQKIRQMARGRTEYAEFLEGIEAGEDRKSPEAGGS